MDIRLELWAYKNRKRVLDYIKGLFVLFIMCIVFWLLMESSVWGRIAWAILWLPTGFPIIARLVALLMSPLYQFAMPKKLKDFWESNPDIRS